MSVPWDPFNRETTGNDHSKKEGKIRGGKSKEISRRVEEKKNHGSSQKDESPIEADPAGVHQGGMVGTKKFTWMCVCLRK